MRTAPRSAASPAGGPLAGLCSDPRPAAAPVAFGREGERTRAELGARVAALSALLDGGRWLLLCDDAFDAAACLLALSRCGGVAVLPPNRQPETLRQLAAAARGALCGPDSAVEGLPRELPRVAADAPPAATGGAPRPPDRSAPWIELHTSGTTGAPRRSVKCLAHLEDEIAVLERLLGPRLPSDARIFATAPHHHIYGLLFRVLWPLASGRPFQIETPLHVRELAGLMARAAPCALVTTPVHLRHLTAGGGLGSLRGACRALFSSGGPLDAATARAAGEQLGEAPFEILGSTETGGVALRQRSLHGEWWSPFPEVAVERDGDGALLVTSAFVSEGTPVAGGRRRFRMGDRIELASDGRFRLLGRVDRSVKIGGVRLSLPAMESTLESHPFVREAALLALTRGSEPRVVAAVVLSEAGRAALERDGRRACGRALAAHLAAGFDPVLLPRAWRYLDALPRNAQGKLPRGAVEALFGEPSARRRLTRSIRVDAELACLDGHFPGHPIVPGVAQLGWVLEAAAELLGREPRARALEALKFPTPLRPGDACELAVELAGDTLRFELREGARTFATGRLRLAAEDGPP